MNRKMILFVCSCCWVGLKSGPSLNCCWTIGSLELFSSNWSKLNGLVGLTQYVQWNRHLQTGDSSEHVHRSRQPFFRHGTQRKQLKNRYLAQGLKGSWPAVSNRNWTGNRHKPSSLTTKSRLPQGPQWLLNETYTSQHPWSPIYYWNTV